MINHTKWFTSDPKSKQDKVKVINFKKLSNIQTFEFLLEIFYVAHLLKLLDKMYKYEMVLNRIVGTTEWTMDAGWTDGWNETNIPPNNFVVLGV